MRLYDLGIEAGGLLKLLDCFRLMAATEECEAGEEMELRRGGVALECGLECVDGAGKLISGCIPTAEEDSVIGSWMCNEIGDQLLRTGASGFGGRGRRRGEGGDVDGCPDGP